MEQFGEVFLGLKESCAATHGEAMAMIRFLCGALTKPSKLTIHQPYNVIL